MLWHAWKHVWKYAFKHFESISVWNHSFYHSHFPLHFFVCSTLLSVTCEWHRSLQINYRALFFTIFPLLVSTNYFLIILKLAINNIITQSDSIFDHQVCYLMYKNILVLNLGIFLCSECYCQRPVSGLTLTIVMNTADFLTLQKTKLWGISHNNAYVIITENLLKIQSALASLSCINKMNDSFRVW